LVHLGKKIGQPDEAIGRAHEPFGLPQGKIRPQADFREVI